jgi:hypothetical protein
MGHVRLFVFFSQYTRSSLDSQRTGIKLLLFESWKRFQELLRASKFSYVRLKEERGQ